MASKLSVAETHVELERLLGAFVAFCQQHDLTYYLCYGSLLGAVRGGQIIPWDDDIDVLMPRSDYEKFKSLYPQRAASGTSLMSPGDTDYPTPFVKLVSTRTTFESARYIFPEGFGLSMDVFPLDSVGARGAALRFRAMHRLLKLCYSAYPHEKNRVVVRASPLRFAKLLAWYTLKRPRELFPWLFGKMGDGLDAMLTSGARRMPRRRLMDWANRLAAGSGHQGAGDVADLFGWAVFADAIIPERHLREPQNVKLGNLTVTTFSEPEVLLEKWYGSDWRTPDPSAKPPHGVAFWKEGEGTGGTIDYRD